MKTKNFTPLFVEFEEYYDFHKNILCQSKYIPNKVYKECIHLNIFTGVDITNLWLTLRYYENRNKFYEKLQF